MMKRVTSLIISALLVCGLAITAWAEKAQYDTAGDLYQAWRENRPDYICGVWSTDGSEDNLTFGIQNNEAGNKGKEEMLGLVADDSSITFEYQIFSYHYLLQIQNELNVYLEKDLGIISTALDEIHNYVAIGILEGREKETDTQRAVEEIAQKYGDAVAFEIAGEIFPAVRYIYPLSKGVNPGQLLLWIGMITVVLCIFAFVTMQKQKQQPMQTNMGLAVWKKRKPSAKEVKDMVEKNDYEVSSNLEQRIIEKIEKKI